MKMSSIFYFLTVLCVMGSYSPQSTEFDGIAVNSANWRFENWAPGRVNNELQRYVAGGELDWQKTAKKTLSGAESGFHTYALEWTKELFPPLCV